MTFELIEVLVPGAQGAKGAKGDKGDIGDVTPEARAARDAAIAAQIAAEDAFAIASAGFVGPVTTAGGYHFRSVIFDETNRVIRAGFDLEGRFVVWNGETFAPITGVNLASIQAALGYTPADQADIADLATTGFIAPTTTVGGFDLIWGIVTEQDNRVLLGITAAGETVALINNVLTRVGTGGGISAEPAPGYSYDALTGTVARHDDDAILMVVGWGQSLVRADIGTVPGDTPFTTTPLDPGFSLMFDAGVVPDGAACNAFVDLVNPTSPVPRETAGPRMFNIIQSRLDAVFGAKRQMVWAVAGAGGATYLEMARGTTVYREMLRLVERGAAIAQSTGKRLIVVIWDRHGEADLWRTAQAYAENKISLQRDAETDIKAITGQVEPVLLMLTQPSRGSAAAAVDPGTATGMMLAAKMNPSRIIMIGPIYYAVHDPADPAHPTSRGYVQIGETSGHALTDYLFGNDWRPTRIEDVRWIAGGSNPQLRLRYTRPVVVDTSGAAVSPTGLAAAGFDVLQGSTAIAINTVTPTPAALTFSIVGNALTLGPGSDTATVRTNGDTGPVGVTVTVDGVRYDIFADVGDGLTEVAQKMVDLIPGATRSGRVVTISGASSIQASAATTDIVLTLASAPSFDGRLLYACRATGAGAGNPNGARGLVREWRRLGLSAIPGTPPLHHWACVEALDLPRL